MKEEMKELINYYEMNGITKKQIKDMSIRYLGTMPDSQVKVLLYLLTKEINTTN